MQLFTEILARAKNGDSDALGQLLAVYCVELDRLAQRKIESGIRARVSASDIVQQTCLEAHRDVGAFKGRTEPEFVAWLRRILQNNLAETVQRHVFTAKRTTDKERPLDFRGTSTNGRGVQLAAPASTPSGKAQRQEEERELLAAIEKLPKEQSEAVRLRHLQGRSLKQLAEHFGRTEVAVAGLLKRGMQKLRANLKDSCEE